MWKISLAIGLGFAMFPGIASAADQCQPVDRRWEFPSPDVSLSEMERIGLEKARSRPAAPQVPWAYGHKDWLDFKSTYRSGDRIRPYSLAFQLGERPYQWGYALFRGKCLLLVFPVRTA